MNQWTGVGRLGKDPELRKTNSGTSVVTLNMATSERRKKDGEWEDHTEWHQIVVWAKRAENCEKYLSKGSQIAVTGSIQTRKWEDKDGNTRYSTEISASDIEFLSSKKHDGPGTTAKTEEPTESSGPNVDPDNIPF